MKPSRRRFDRSTYSLPSAFNNTRTHSLGDERIGRRAIFCVTEGSITAGRTHPMTNLHRAMAKLGVLLDDADS
jgi:hypothetical protein